MIILLQYDSYTQNFTFLLTQYTSHVLIKFSMNIIISIGISTKSMSDVNQSTLHIQSQIIVARILQQILDVQIENDVIPTQLIFQACLHDSLIIQNSIFNVYSNPLNQQPNKLVQNQECKPLSLNFKVKKPHLVHKQASKKIIRSKSSASKCSVQAFKYHKNIELFGQNTTKAQPLKLSQVKQCNSKRQKVRYASILNENPNIRQIFKYHSDHTEDKNDTIQRILRERKNNQVPFLQKSEKMISVKKCETKRAKDQAKKILSVNTDYKGFPVLLCKNSQMNIPTTYIQMSFIVMDEKVEQKDGNQSKRTRKAKKRQDLIKMIEHQQLKFAHEKDLFSRKFLQKLPIQKKQDVLSQNRIQQIESLDLKTKARNIPSKVSFQSLFKLKSTDSSSICRQHKKPLQKKHKKTITFNFKQKSLISSLSRNSAAFEDSTTLNLTQTNKTKGSKIILGNESAFNLLLNPQERHKFQNIYQIQKDN